jgi:hypothetical protein
MAPFHVWKKEWIRSEFLFGWRNVNALITWMLSTVSGTHMSAYDLFSLCSSSTVLVPLSISTAYVHPFLYHRTTTHLHRSTSPAATMEELAGAAHWDDGQPWLERAPVPPDLCVCCESCL